MPSFTPPSVSLRPDPNTPAPFNRMRVSVGTSVLKFGTSYVPRTCPTDAEVASADIAYIGGRTYQITPAEAASLTAAGYTVAP